MYFSIRMHLVATCAKALYSADEHAAGTVLCRQTCGHCVECVCVPVTLCAWLL